MGLLTLTSLSCSSLAKSNNLFLRDDAKTASTACDTYFSALNEFAYNSEDAAAVEALGKALESLETSLLTMNSGIVLADKETNSHPENRDTLFKITKVDKTEAEVQEFLTQIIQEQCAKWRAFALYTDSEIDNYFLNTATSSTSSTSNFCQAAENEASKIITPQNILIKKCSAQVAPGKLKPSLILELNSWMDWIDMNSLPTSSEIDKYIFDFPLQLMLEGLRNSDSNPLDYESILIVSHGESMTVYELDPTDLKLALDDPRDLNAVLLDLRDKMIITG